MNPVVTDPDIKINMSLDEIISLTKEEINGQLRKRNFKTQRKKNRRNDDHDGKVMPLTCGVDFQGPRKSQLLNDERRRRAVQAVSNRAMNSDIIQKAKEIVPAEYKFIRTHYGIERILVPAPEFFSKPPQRQLTKHGLQNKNYERFDSGVCNKSIPDKPPPLMSVPIFSPPHRIKQNDFMKDNKSDGEIVILNVNPKKELEVIDLECNLPVDVIEAKRMCVGTSVPKKTLSERFSMLTGNLQF